ncbi:MAG: 3-deoxy-manno-octulosonate cytidylyltransferase [Flavobacteriaceae bacterium]|nr:3-deoxy-manno-octulosonate cytidylyltransferase [Flavobacteriaceae bacterium]MBL6692752.1 3-deoxy-manno-octulosonate cytidylyltransferase [Flavobacteriaceae bacterium]
MKIVSIIPARYDSMRFPGKLMQQLGDITVILRTYQNVVATGLFDEVLVATDSDLIFKEISDNGGRALMTRRDHQCGSDRIAEAASGTEADIVINVQGDEPFVDGDSLKKLIEVFKDDPKKEIALASLMTPLHEAEEVENPSVVKVIVDLNNFALYFSRSPIPFDRDNEQSPPYYKHVGVYAFRKQALIEFSEQEMTPLESAEKIECIRYLEHGKKIKMVETLKLNFGIDTPKDLERAKAHLKQLNSE